MKKFYAFLAAALISVSAFASANVVPSDAVLANYYDAGQVCACFFVPSDMNCNDMIVTGSFNGWKTNPAECLIPEPVEGYDGWYVCSWEPEAEPAEDKGIQAKPIMLGANGEFNWAYQIGAATVIRGGMQVVQGQYEGEVDLINYGTDAPNVFTVDAWKTNPCTAVYHNYKVTVISDGCNGYACPFIIGDMNNWAWQQMQYDIEASQAENADVYVITFKAAEGTKYQICSGLWNDQGEIETMPAWVDDAYMQKLSEEGVWGRIPGEDGDNQLTHEEANIVWDLRAEDLRWARCDDTPAEHVVMWVNLPVENRPEAVEIIGPFGAGWDAGTGMELLDNGWFFVELEAKPSHCFKFRGAGSWDQELEIYNEAEDTWAKIGDADFIFGNLWQDGSYKGVDCKLIEEFDLSNPALARWTVKEEGIENITLTEKAQKVVVDGVIYIVRDNKMFNLQGAQVR